MDWPSHRQRCAYLAQLAAANADLGKVEPSRRLQRKDVSRLPEHFIPRLAVVARTALHFGRPTSLTRTHIFQLVLRYHPEQADWIDRFAFQSIRVLPIDQADQEDRTDFISKMKEVWRDDLVKAQADPIGAASNENFFTSVVIHSRQQGAPATQALCT